MLEPDTLLTPWSVMTDTFCTTNLPTAARSGPDPSLTRREGITRALVGQWAHVHSERAFCRSATRHVRPAFPALPERAQVNRLVRTHRAARSTVAGEVDRHRAARAVADDALDGSGVAPRNAKRRGAGWRAGNTDSGGSNRLGWYQGLHLVLAGTPHGVSTGFGVGAASTTDQPLANTFFALRHTPDLPLPSEGYPAAGPDVADPGFAGATKHAHWAAAYHAQVMCPPRRTRRRRWSQAWRRWPGGVRHIVETVYHTFHSTFGLARERPHDLTGCQARLAANVALHNCCIWLNVQLERACLACADLIEW